MDKLRKHFSDARFLQFVTMDDLRAFADMLAECSRYAAETGNAALMQWAASWYEGALHEIAWREQQREERLL